MKDSDAVEEHDNNIKLENRIPKTIISVTCGIITMVNGLFEFGPDNLRETKQSS